MTPAAHIRPAMAHAAGREALNDEMVREARTALACYGAKNMAGFHAHRARARELADLLEIPVAAPRDANGHPADWTLQTR